MNTPFVYGRIADKENFTDRDQEVKLLTQNFNSLVNTVIISPRRWGKHLWSTKRRNYCSVQVKTFISVRLIFSIVAQKKSFMSL